MSRVTIAVGAAVAVVVAASLVAAHHPKPKPKPHPSPSAIPTAPASSCDKALLQHVYHPQRLAVIAPCKTITGVIQFDRTEADGDHHILLKPDDPSVINSVNVSKQHSDLVVEPVCVGPVSQADAVSSCQGFTSNVVIPAVGTHVAVTGQYVTDTQHGGWTELHPVTSIVVVGKLAAEQVPTDLQDWTDDNGDA